MLRGCYDERAPVEFQLKASFTSQRLFQHVCVATATLCGRVGVRSVERGDLAVPRTAMKLNKHSFLIEPHRPYATLFLTIYAHHPSPMDNFGVAYQLTSSSKPTASENRVFKLN